MTEKAECYFAQLSILKFGIRINSFSLFVTRVQAIESAWAAISISREPIGVPCFSKIVIFERKRNNEKIILRNMSGIIAIK